MLFHKVSSAQVSSSTSGANNEPMESPRESLSRLLCFHLLAKSAMQRFCASQTLLHWLVLSNQLGDQLTVTWPDYIVHALHTCLVESIYYDEMALTFTRLQKEVKDFIAALQQHQVDVDALFQTR